MDALSKLVVISVNLNVKVGEHLKWIDKKTANSENFANIYFCSQNPGQSRILYFNILTLF